MWAATFGTGVARSLDGGATWAIYRSGLINTFVRSLAVEPNHPDSVFCGTNDGVYLSADGGVNWTRVLSTLSGGTIHSVRSIAIRPVRTGVIYATTFGLGVFKSVNGGASWTSINVGLTNTTIRTIAIHPTKPETLLAGAGTSAGIHRSVNGGLSWVQLSDTTATNGACQEIQYDLLNPLRVYAAELDRGVLKSEDGGISWKALNTGLTTLRTRSLSVVDTLRYVGTDGAGVFFTTLNDPSWHAASAGLSGSIVEALFSSGSAPGTCWAGTDGFGISRTDSRGTTWTALDGGLLNTFSFSLAIRPSTHTVYDGCGFGDQFWKSADNGSTWTRTSFLFTHDSEHGVTPDPVLPQRVYLSAYGGGVYRSDDDGATFSNPDSLNLTLGNHFVRPLVAWPGQSDHLFLGAGDGVWESVDGGSHWSARLGGLPAGFGVHSLALVPGSPATLYAGSDSSGVWKSVDGGNSWSASSSGLASMFVHALVVDGTNSLVVYAATDSGVWKSLNGGTSWARASTGLPSGALGSVRALAQDPIHPTVLFCGVFGSGVFESTNGGANWASVFAQAGLSSLNVRSIAVDGAPLTVYAGTDDGVAALSNYLTALVVDPAPLAGGSLEFAVWPNPARDGALTLSFALTRPGRAVVEVFDVTGQRVRTLERRNDEAAGRHTLSWDRRDAHGHAVASGVYFLRLDTLEGTRATRISITER